MESYIPYKDIQFAVNQKTIKYTWRYNYSAQKSIILWELMSPFRILQSLWNIIMNISLQSRETPISRDFLLTESQRN